MSTYEEDRLEDKQREETFLKKLGKQEEVKKEVDIMCETYEERLKHLVKLRFDMEILSYLIIAEPHQKSHMTDKANAEVGLRRNRKAIKIIREQILEKLGKKKDVKTDKPSKIIQEGKK